MRITRTKSNIAVAVVTALLLGSAVLAASAAGPEVSEYSITWDVVAAGGGTISGGEFTVQDTVGQAATGNSEAEDTSITLGFWALKPLRRVDDMFMIY
jgi:hypothetical protein